uniref:Uncharacterized protein n=1 Tax=Arundo donax TaxID=35708 RepID=A0A0A9FUZ5_ARUDO
MPCPSPQLPSWPAICHEQAFVS